MSSHAVCRLQVLELARLHEHVAFERADGFVVRLEARLEPRAQLVEVRAELANRFVEVASELADLTRVLLHRFLLPAVRHSPQQRNQRRRTCRDNVLRHAGRAKFDERRILLERGAEEHFAREKHDDEIGTGMDVRGIALRCELNEVRPHLPRVFDEEQLPGSLVRRLERFQVRIERGLRVHDHEFPARQPDDDVRPHAPVLGGERLLLFEVAVLDHAGELDDALQLELAPSPANAGTFERIDQARRFPAKILARHVDGGHSLEQLRAGFDAAALRVFDFLVDLIERALHRSEQILDGFPAGVDVGCRLFARLAEPRFRKVEKRAVVGLECLGAQRLERVAQAGLRPVVRRNALCMRGTVALERNLQPHLLRTRSEPADKHADGKGDKRSNDSNGRDGH